MADLYNNFPSWGESGEYPASGFFYEGGDQVNEKHMDALWNGIDDHLENINTAIRDRIRDVHGDVVLDQGLVASTGSGTREVDVTASSAGAYVDGQRSGSTSATTLTHTANGGTTTRTDVVWVDTSGTVGKTEGTTSPSSGRAKIAEVDVEPDDTISDVRNYGRDHRETIASEQAPSSPDPGDLWHDLLNSRAKVYQGGSFRSVATGQDTITLSGGDGLKNGNSGSLPGGLTLTLDVEPADFAGHGVEDDGADNLRLDAAAMGVGISGGDGVDLSLDESVIKDGGAKEVDASELAGSAGTAGQVLETDGAAASWADVTSDLVDISDDGTLVISDATDINFGSNISVTDDGDGTVTVEGTSSGDSIPSGTITIWSGSIANIPSGWVLCDGNNGTPNLQDRFVVGAGNVYTVGNTGGATSVTLSESQIPSHGSTTGDAGSHDHGGVDTASSFVSVASGSDHIDVWNGLSSTTTDSTDIGSLSISLSSDGSHTHPINSAGGDGSHENRPPYHALAYIMKT